METTAPPDGRPLVVLLPPEPPPGVAPDVAAALGLGLLLDHVDAHVDPAVDLRVAVADRFAAPLVAALLPPGVAPLVLAPGDREAALRALGAQVVRVDAGAPADLAAALDRRGAPSPAPRAWHLAHRLPELAHSG